MEIFWRVTDEKNKANYSLLRSIRFLNLRQAAFSLSRRLRDFTTRPLVEEASVWKWIRVLAWPLGILPDAIFTILWRIMDIAPGRLGSVLRYVLLAPRLNSCGDNVFLGPMIVIDHPKRLSLGSHVSIHHAVTLLSGGGIRIDDNVAIAHGCSLVSGNHTYEDRGTPIRFNPVQLAEIRIHSDVWLGCGVRVLAGVEVAERTVVAAASVVTKSIGPTGLYAGAPARWLKSI